MQSVVLKSEALYSLGHASISGTYALVGTIVNPSQVYFVQNLTDVTITFSQDGVHDTFQLPSMGYLLIDAGSNKGNFNSLSFPQGTVLYAKGSPSSGQVNLTSWYMG